MDFSTILARLNDLPYTFKRSGPPYTQLIDALAAGMTPFAISADGNLQQVQNFSHAIDGWLDVWGLLWGVARQTNEANSAYSTRISRTVLAWVGTLPAIQVWLAQYAVGGSVTENASGLGYALTLPSFTAAQTLQFLGAFNRIRPAGVPFTVQQVGTGVFLGTEDYLSQGTVQGSYLSAGLVALALGVSASTPNSVPLLPTLYFEDMYLGQPALAAAAGVQ